MFEGSPTGDGNGKIVLPYKWRDEERSFDLSDPNERAKASELLSKAYGYEKSQEQLKAVKGELADVSKQVEYWNGLIEEAKDSGDTSRVLSALEMAGLKVSGKKAEDDDFILDESDKKVEELQKKLDRLEGALYAKYTGDIHAQMEAKYNNGTYPEYNKKEVEDFADKRGITNFEDAYKIMHMDELMELKAKADKDKNDKHRNKINRVAQPEPGTGKLPPNPPKRHKNYGETTKDWLNDPEIVGNLFLED
jgi:hypothetical protein